MRVRCVRGGRWPHGPSAPPLLSCAHCHRVRCDRAPMWPQLEGKTICGCPCVCCEVTWTRRSAHAHAHTRTHSHRWRRGWTPSTRCSRPSPRPSCLPAGSAAWAGAEAVEAVEGGAADGEGGGRWWGVPFERVLFLWCSIHVVGSLFMDNVAGCACFPIIVLRGRS